MCWIFSRAAGCWCPVHGACDRQQGTRQPGGCFGWVGMPLPKTHTHTHTSASASASNMLRQRFPPTGRGMKGYKVQISSLSCLAKVHLSVRQSSLQAIRLYLFINPTHSLFIAAILFHKVSDVPTHKQAPSLFFFFFLFFSSVCSEIESQGRGVSWNYWMC